MGDGTDGVGTARRERLIAESGSGSRALARREGWPKGSSECSRASAMRPRAVHGYLQ